MGGQRQRGAGGGEGGSAVHRFPSWRYFQFSTWNVSLNPSNLRAISRRPAAPKSSSCSGRDKPQLPTRPTRPTRPTQPTCPTRPTRPEARWERSARRATRRRGCGHVTPGVKAGAAIALRESVSPARGARSLSRGDGRAGRPGGASAATRRVGENRPGHPVDSAQSRCFLSFLSFLSRGGPEGSRARPRARGLVGPPTSSDIAAGHSPPLTSSRSPRGDRSVDKAPPHPAVLHALGPGWGPPFSRPGSEDACPPPVLPGRDTAFHPLISWGFSTNCAPVPRGGGASAGRTRDRERECVTVSVSECDRERECDCECDCERDCERECECDRV